MRGLPRLDATAVSSGRYCVDLGIGLKSFALAVLGGRHLVPGNSAEQSKSERQ